MNIEIHKPELEQCVRGKIEGGHFRDVDELLEKALDALQEKDAAAPTARNRPPGGKSLVDLFAESPLKGLELDFSRNKSTGRPVDLS